jgi:3-hydroxyisobutyrate dehydrogenase-like beta-hydroxyacid dehydrogenase
MGAMFAAKGAHFLDAPCTGSKPGAENGTLTFMVGGDQALRARSHTSKLWGSDCTIASRWAGLRAKSPRTWCSRI